MTTLPTMQRSRPMSLLNPDKDQFIRFPHEEPPRLLISIDAEEEFDWNEPVARRIHSVKSMEHQWRAHAIFEKYKAIPTYMIDYPVATEKKIYEKLKALRVEGRCDIGTHLHPWTNPPHEEELSTHTSFPGNLPADLEHRKLRAITEIIAENLDYTPRIYRAGRYGVGASTARIIEELGYKIDMSIIPLRDYSRLGGPDFRHLAGEPYWFGSNRDMLEIPLTGGYIGGLRSGAKQVAAILNSPLVARLHIPGLLARTGLFSRAYITPEGIPVGEAKNLTRRLYRDGYRVFTLHYHSPSLEPGNTPYVRSNADLEKFLYWLDTYLDFFVGELGGVASTPMAIYERARNFSDAVTAVSHVTRNPVARQVSVPR
jgi:hypothetical protein